MIQRHHLIYQNDDHRQKEEVVIVTKGEHRILTLLNWHTKNIQSGFVKSLKMWIVLNEDKVVKPEIGIGDEKK